MPASDSSENACSDELRGRLDALVLDQLGASIESVESVAAGLGSRHFFRLGLSSGAASAIARVDMPEDPGLRPPGVAAEPPLEPIREHLETNGLPVPKRLAASDGIELLEDVGQLTLEDVAANGESPERSALYGRAIDLIIDGIDEHELVGYKIHGKYNPADLATKSHPQKELQRLMQCFNLRAYPKGPDTQSD